MRRGISTLIKTALVSLPLAVGCAHDSAQQNRAPTASAEYGTSTGQAGASAQYGASGYTGSYSSTATPNGSMSASGSIGSSNDALGGTARSGDTQSQGVPGNIDRSNGSNGFDRHPVSGSGSIDTPSSTSSDWTTGNGSIDSSGKHSSGSSTFDSSGRPTSSSPSSGSSGSMDNDYGSSSSSSSPSSTPTR